MEYVLEMGCDVNAANALGETPLHLAAAMHFEGKIQFDLCSFPKPWNILFKLLNINMFEIRAGRDEHHPVPAGEGRGHRRAHPVGRHGGALRGAQGDEGGARPRVRRGRLHRQGQGQRRIQGGLILWKEIKVYKKAFFIR